MTTSPDLDSIRAACRAFPQGFKTLYLGTSASDGQPEASYAPFVADKGKYYVYLSDLARHSANLRANPRCSVLFIEAEGEAQHLFARKRLTLRCAVREHERSSEAFEHMLALFQARFGKFMEVIRPLQDFRLFELAPLSGSYVAGFAKAYALDGHDLADIRHRQEQGHLSPDAASQSRLAQELSP
jgi:putative heme iron utilization protein